MIVNTNDLVSLANFAKEKKVSRQYINQSKDRLPIVVIDGTPYIDRSKLDIISTHNIIVPIQSNEVIEDNNNNNNNIGLPGDEVKNTFLDY